MISRRRVLAGAGFGLGTLAFIAPLQKAMAAIAGKVTHSDTEWRKLLSPSSYDVLRRKGTERAFTSPLLNEYRPGTFACAGCDLPLFSSKSKFESGTGWPSFYEPLPNAVIEESDTSFGMARTEVACSRCDGHLGHVFNDGPKPTGLRYCMNGIALKFTPSAAWTD